MRAGGFSGDINAHGEGQPPGDGDIGVAAFVEQHLHGDDPVAEQNQDHGAEKFGQKLSREPVVHRYSIPDPQPIISKMMKRLLAAIALGTILIAMNHAGVIAGVLQPPAGYEPLWVTRDLEIAQYLTWRALAKDHWLLPDYHAPWRTEGALFQPLFEMVGRSGLPVRVAYYLFDILCYWAASLGLIEAARVFCKTRRQ